MADDQQGSPLDPPPHEWGSPPPPPPPADTPPDAGQDAPRPDDSRADETSYPQQPPAQPQPPQAQGQYGQPSRYGAPSPYGGPNPYGAPNPYGPPGTAGQHGVPSQPAQPQHPAQHRQPPQPQTPQAQPPQPHVPQSQHLQAPQAGAQPHHSSYPDRQHARPAPRQPGGRSSVPKLVAALATVLAAVLVTAYSTFWIWHRADALTPVDLPSANVTPLETVTPSAKPLPPPDGHLRDGVITNGKGDEMPALPAPRWKQEWDKVTLGGVAQWMTVHKNYDGKGNTWGDLIGFGIFDGSGDEKWTYSSKPADLNYASRLVGARMLNRLYDGKAYPIKGTVKHRTLTIDGHPAHELIARIPVKQPKLAETYSQLAMIVIDRGDGSAAVAYGDFAGTSAAHWLAVWRRHVAQITIAE